MAKYSVKEGCGAHYQADGEGGSMVRYEAGSVFESSQPLDTLFPDKIRKVSGSDTQSEAAVDDSGIPADATDVTDSFECGEDFAVFKKGREYFVEDADGEVTLVKSKKAVKALLSAE